MALVGSDRAVQPGTLPVGELLLTTAQDRADAVERVVLAATVAVDLLLHTLAVLVDGLGAELDHMERVEHSDRILELVIDGVVVAVERIQRGGLDPVLEVLAAFFEPVALRLARPVGDQVEQPRLRPACVGIRGEVDHPGQLLGSTAAVLDRTNCHKSGSTLVDSRAGLPDDHDLTGVRGVDVLPPFAGG